MALIRYVNPATGDLIVADETLRAFLVSNGTWQTVASAPVVEPDPDADTQDLDAAPVIDTPAAPVRATRPRKGTRTP